MKTLLRTSALILALNLLTSTASAQSADAWGQQPAQPQPAQPVQQQPLQAQPTPQEAQAQPAPAGDLTERPDVGYHSLGARFRWIFVPEWFVTMFGVDIRGGDKPLVSNVGFGAEYIYRKNNLDITAAIWAAGLKWEKPIFFKDKDEPDTAWEVVSNDITAVLFTADFIWSTPIRPWVAITYGVGLGFGIAAGDIVRNEARVDAAGNPFEACDGPGGNVGCEPEPDGNYNETAGPPVVPWINVLVGARFKPHEHLALYVDGGFGLGFQMGVRAGYIF